VEVEVALADQRQDAALEPDHRANESVQPDEQAELARVRAQAKLNAAHAWTAIRPVRLAATIASCPRAVAAHRRATTPARSCRRRCA
jgi:hypothetical protein